MFEVKAYYKDEVRRFPLPGGFDALQNKIKEVFQLGNKEFSIAYTDSENEIITVSSNVELQSELQRQLQLMCESSGATAQIVFKLYVSDRSSVDAHHLSSKGESLQEIRAFMAEFRKKFSGLDAQIKSVSETVKMVQKDVKSLLYAKGDLHLVDGAILNNQDQTKDNAPINVDPRDIQPQITAQVYPVSATMKPPLREVIPDIREDMKKLLNGLTADNFNDVTEQFKVIVSKDLTPDIVDCMNSLILKKATKDAQSCKMAADFAKQFQLLKVPCQDNPDQPDVLRISLIRHCQILFEFHCSNETDTSLQKAKIEACKDLKKRKDLQKEFDSEYDKNKREFNGVCRFIAEMFNVDMIPGRIIHGCLAQLLESESELLLEGACTLLSVAGETLQAKSTEEGSMKIMDNHFISIQNLLLSPKRNIKSNSKISGMLLDIIELRQNNWKANWKTSSAGENTKSKDAVAAQATTNGTSFKSNATPRPFQGSRNESSVYKNELRNLVEANSEPTNDRDVPKRNDENLNVNDLTNDLTRNNKNRRNASFNENNILKNNAEKNVAMQSKKTRFNDTPDINRNDANSFPWPQNQSSLQPSVDLETPSNDRNVWAAEKGIAPQVWADSNESYPMPLASQIAGLICGDGNAVRLLAMYLHLPGTPNDIGAANQSFTVAELHSYLAKNRVIFPSRTAIVVGTRDILERMKGVAPDPRYSLNKLDEIVRTIIQQNRGNKVLLTKIIPPIVEHLDYTISDKFVQEFNIGVDNFRNTFPGKVYITNFAINEETIATNGVPRPGAFDKTLIYWGPTVICDGLRIITHFFTDTTIM